MFKKYNSFIFKCLLLYFSWVITVFAGEVIHSHVQHEGDTYHASIEMQINAPSKEVYALFTDFNYLSRLSDNITDSHIIEEDPPEYTVLVETHNCVLFFCKDIQQTQQVSELGEGYISVDDVKGQSDFVFASSRWHIRPHKEGTRVSFSSEMKPDFWLPPFLGPWLFKKSLIEETQNMIEQLEKLAAHE